jgi:hypothetical protein
VIEGSQDVKLQTLAKAFNVPALIGLGVLAGHFLTVQMFHNGHFAYPHPTPPDNILPGRRP